MRGEVRNLTTGSYLAEDESAMLRVSVKDNGVVIEVADFDADIFYEFVVDEKGDATFDYGQIGVDIGE